jgi:site-specific DNA recombinase
MPHTAARGAPGGDRPERPAVYSRQSHAKLKSIDDQTRAGVTDSQRLFRQMPALYSDDTSASRYGTKPRGGWSRILADIHSGEITWLWLWESSRGDRQASEWLDFLELCHQRQVGIHIHSHGRTYDVRVRRDWKSLAEDGIDNEDESRKISERVLRGLGSSAEQGRPHGVAPFGYVRIYHERTGAYVTQEPDETPRAASGGPWTAADIVRQVYNDFRTGTGINAIVNNLNDRGIPTPRMLTAAAGAPMGPERWAHAQWTPVVVRRMLKNPSYIGRRASNGRTIEEGGWTPLIKVDHFYAVQKILGDPARRVSRPNRAKYLLSCLIRCALCDNGGKVIFGPPNTYRCVRTHAAVPRDALDAAVTHWIIQYVTVPGRLKRMREVEEGNSEELSTARAEADRLSAELEAWRAQLDDPLLAVSAASFSRREAALMAAQAEAERRATSGAGMATLRAFTGTPTEGTATALWLRLPLAVQRQVVRELVEVTIWPVGKGHWGTRRGDPFTAGRIRILPRLEEAPLPWPV